MSTFAYRAVPPTSAAAQAGLAAPPTAIDPRYAEAGWRQVSPRALATASMTATSAGGAPGAQFGGPGVGSAPVTTSFGLTPGLVIAGLAIAAALYFLTKGSA